MLKSAKALFVGPMKSQRNCTQQCLSVGKMRMFVCSALCTDGQLAVAAVSISGFVLLTAFSYVVRLTQP